MKPMNTKGASAVEFAIILPVLVLLLFGIIEFSILLYNKAMITNACREGARAGIVYAYPDRISPEEITNTVNAYCGSSLITFGGSSIPVCKVDPDPLDDSSSGDPLKVTVTYHYDFLVLPNFISTLVGGIDLSSETIMRLE